MGAVRGCIIASAAFAAVALSPWVHAQTAGDATLVSKTAANIPGDEETSKVAISPNSKLLVFESSATNIDPLKTSRQSDIFRLFTDSAGQKVPRLYIRAKLPRGDDGGMPDAGAESPSVSRVASDGETFAVAFSSKSKNLLSVIPVGTDPQEPGSQVYLRVEPSGEQVLVSQGGSGVGIVFARGDSVAPQVAMVSESPPAYRVAFLSTSPDLTPSGLFGEGPFAPYVATVTKTAFSGWSVAIRRVPDVRAESDFRDLQISADGTSIIYSTAEVLLGGDGLRLDTYVQQASGNGAPEHVCPSAKAQNRSTYGGSLSYSGDVRMFLMDRPGVANMEADVYWNRLDDNASLPPRQINVSQGGALSDGTALSGRVSPNGEYAVFADTGRNLVSVPGSNLIYHSQVYFKGLRTGLVALISAQPTRGQPYLFGSGGPSGRPVIGGEPFSSLKLWTAFVSEANNLIGNPGGTSDHAQAFTVDASLAAPPLYEGAPIAAPPDIVVNGRRATITLQEFTGLADSSRVASATTGQVKYTVEITNNKTRKRIRLVTTRNRVTTRKLSPGRYTVRYRASAKGPGGSVVKSKYSPKGPMTIK